jgi:DNA-directed RNA polymerase subunit RPC12/RpoP
MDSAGGDLLLDARSGTKRGRHRPFCQIRSMTFERPRDYGTPPDDGDLRPMACPECGSKSFGTLAKVITVDTYWRCQGCGAVWNEKRQRANAPRSFRHR